MADSEFSGFANINFLQAGRQPLLRLADNNLTWRVFCRKEALLHGYVIRMKFMVRLPYRFANLRKQVLSRRRKMCCSSYGDVKVQLYLTKAIVE